MQDMCGRSQLFTKLIQGKGHYRLKVCHEYMFDLFVLIHGFFACSFFSSFLVPIQHAFRLYLLLKLLELNKRKRKATKSPIKDSRCIRYTELVKSIGSGVPIKNFKVDLKVSSYLRSKLNRYCYLKLYNFYTKHFFLVSRYSTRPILFALYTYIYIYIYI